MPSSVSVLHMSRQGLLEKEAGFTMTEDDAADMLKKKKVAAAIVGNDDKSNNEYSTYAFTASRQIVRFLGCDPEILASLRRMEERFRSESYLNSMNRLQILATKTSTQQARRWVVLGLEDLINSNLLENEAISKQKLVGDKHVCGLVALLEFKHRCLGHITDVLMVQAQFQDKTRR